MEQWPVARTSHLDWPSCKSISLKRSPFTNVSYQSDLSTYLQNILIPTFQSMLSSTDVRRLILQTQSEPLRNDRRWLSLVNSSSVRSPLADTLIHLPVSQNIKVPELPQYDTTEGNSYDYNNKFKNKLPLYKDKWLYHKLFLETFQGKDIDWYVRFPQRASTHG